MSNSVQNWLGKGLSPAEFIATIEKNREAFVEYLDGFQWANEDERHYFHDTQNFEGLRCLILAAEWCGDVVRNVPVVVRALEATKIPTEVFIMEQHLDLMDEFLTLGGRAIPVVIFSNEEGRVLARWGPRPAHVQAVMTRFKQLNPDRNAADYQEKITVARQEMMLQYGEGTGYQQVVVQELHAVLDTATSQ